MRLLAGDEGSSTVEMAIWMPVLFVTIALAAQLAVWLYAQHAATAAATTVLDQARIRGGSAATATAAGRSQLAGMRLLHHPQLTVVRSPTTATVTVTGTAPRILPIPLRVSAHQTGPVERDTSPAGHVNGQDQP